MILYGLGMCVMFAFCNGCATGGGGSSSSAPSSVRDTGRGGRSLHEEISKPRRSGSPTFDCCASINELNKELARGKERGEIRASSKANTPRSDDQSRDENTYTLYTVYTKGKKCVFTVVTDENDIIKDITGHVCVDDE